MKEIVEEIDKYIHKGWTVSVIDASARLIRHSHRLGRHRSSIYDRSSEFDVSFRYLWFIFFCISAPPCNGTDFSLNVRQHETDIDDITKVERKRIKMGGLPNLT